jgi:hypothetical protein
MNAIPVGALAGALLMLGGCGSQIASDFKRDLSVLSDTVLGGSPSAGRYGAIAVSDRTRDWRIYWDAPSKQDASRVALAECAQPTCRIILDFGPEQCGTVALGSNGFAVGVGRSGAEAEKNARTNCSAKGTGCKVAPAGCNS